MPCLPYICRGRKARQQRQHFIFHQTTGQEWGVVRKDLQDDFVTTDLKVSDAADTGVVGGHADAFTKNELGRISKVADPTELEFYEAASRGLWPSRFLPAYYGVAEAAENEARTIVLQDLTHGFKQPCVLDLKMGQHTRLRDESSLVKLVGMELVDAVSGSSATGVRLVGCKVFQPYASKQFKCDKKAGVRCVLRPALSPPRRMGRRRRGRGVGGERRFATTCAVFVSPLIPAVLRVNTRVVLASPSECFLTCFRRWHVAEALARCRCLWAR